MRTISFSHWIFSKFLSPIRWVLSKPPISWIGGGWVVANIDRWKSINVDPISSLSLQDELNKNMERTNQKIGSAIPYFNEMYNSSVKSQELAETYSKSVKQGVSYCNSDKYKEIADANGVSEESREVHKKLNELLEFTKKHYSNITADSFQVGSYTQKIKEPAKIERKDENVLASMKQEFGLTIDKLRSAEFDGIASGLKAIMDRIYNNMMVYNMKLDAGEDVTDFKIIDEPILEFIKSNDYIIKKELDILENNFERQERVLENILKKINEIEKGAKGNNYENFVIGNYKPFYRLTKNVSFKGGLMASLSPRKTVRDLARSIQQLHKEFNSGSTIKQINQLGEHLRNLKSLKTSNLGALNRNDDFKNACRIVHNLIKDGNGHSKFSQILLNRKYEIDFDMKDRGAFNLKKVYRGAVESGYPADIFDFSKAHNRNIRRLMFAFHKFVSYQGKEEGNGGFYSLYGCSRRISDGLLRIGCNEKMGSDAFNPVTKTRNAISSDKDLEQIMKHIHNFYDKLVQRCKISIDFSSSNPILKGTKRNITSAHHNYMDNFLDIFRDFLNADLSKESGFASLPYDVQVTKVRPGNLRYGDMGKDDSHSIRGEDVLVIKGDVCDDFMEALYLYSRLMLAELVKWNQSRKEYGNELGKTIRGMKDEIRQSKEILDTLKKDKEKWTNILNKLWIAKTKYDSLGDQVRSIIDIEKAYYDSVVKAFKDICPNLFMEKESSWNYADSIIGNGVLNAWRLVLSKVSGKHHEVMLDIDRDVVGLLNDSRNRIKSVGGFAKEEKENISWE